MSEKHYHTYQYRFYPDEEQHKILIEWQGQCRFVWNTFLRKNIDMYDTTKKFMWYNDMSAELTKLKKEKDWLNAPAHAIQNICSNLDKALKNKTKHKHCEFPKFKSKHNDKDMGLIIQQIKNIKKGNYGHIKWNKTHITIPKIGKIKWVYHRPIKGRFISLTLKRDGEHWYVSMLVEQDRAEPILEIKQENCVGLDLGLKDFYVSSDGEIIKSPKFYRKRQKKIVKKQRQLSKKQKKSANRKKAQKRLAREHQKVKFARNNFHHQTSSSIAKNYDVVLIEDLAVKSMIKNPNLSKSISDQGWSSFTTQLAYKMANKGGICHKIDRWAPSTKTCSCCGQKKSITLSERTYQCANCGLVMDRDLNASINILMFGLRDLKLLNTGGTPGIYACGDKEKSCGLEIGSISSDHLSFEAGITWAMARDCCSLEQ